MKNTTDHLSVQTSMIISALTQNAATSPNTVAYRMLEVDASSYEVSFENLLKKVKQCASRLTQNGIQQGDVCMLIFPQGIEFIISFLACNYMGAIPTPLNKPTRNKSLDKWKKIASDCAAKAVLTDGESLNYVSKLFATSETLTSLSLIAIDTAFDELESIEQSSHEIAFLQYTSGSTGSPKGVMVTQDCLFNNLKEFKKRLEFDQKSVMVSWLPFYHDMGLIFGILQGIFTGYTTVLIRPSDFMAQPLFWLKAMTRYSATHSGGPNFSLELIASKLEALKTEEEKNQISLASLKVLVCGAEPVHIKTMERFNKVAMDFGMNTGVVCPSYGLAEATLAVSVNNDGGNIKWLKLDKEQLHSNKVVIKDQGIIDPFSKLIFENEPSDIFFVSNGPVIDNHQLTIRDIQSNRILNPFEIGELWFGGPSVTKGYYRKEDLTKASYVKEPDCGYLCLKTGDLGFLDEERNVYVTGRIKDVIIMKGLNHYPQDIERTVFTSSIDLRTDGTAAFSVTKDHQEKLVIVQELTRAAIRTPQFKDWTEKMIEAIIRHHEIIVDTILFVPPMHVPRTTSGKIQRRKAKLMYLNNEWSKVLSIYQREEMANNVVEFVDSEHSLRAYTIQLFADQLGISETSIDADHPFIEMGITSLMSLYIRDHLDQVLGQPVQTTDLFNYNTIDTLTNYLWNKENEVKEFMPIVRKEQPSDSEEENIDDLSEAALLSLLSKELKN